MIQSVVEMKELMTDVVKYGYHVVYEKCRESEVVQNGTSISEVEHGIEENIKILKMEHMYDSALPIGVYRLGGEHKTIDDVLMRIKDEHTEIFN